MLGMTVAITPSRLARIFAGLRFSAGYVIMNWAEAMDGGVDSRQAANRFVTGALRRIRIRTKVKELMWMEGMVATSQRSVTREMEEMFPSQD
jgi:hypothetical protein